MAIKWFPIIVGLFTALAVRAQNAPAIRNPILRQVPYELAPKTTQTDKRKSPFSQPKEKRIFKKIDLTPFKLQREEKGNGGEWGSSGGGSGVACFKSSEVADRASLLISKNEILPDDLIDQIENLYVLEYWEWLNHKKYPLRVLKSENVQGALREIHHGIARLTPLFAYRLQQAEDMIQISEWNNKEQVPAILDAKPEFEMGPNCRQIQLVARYAKDFYQIGEGPSQRVPLVKVDVNAKLFHKLNLINQTILIVHEQMYLIAQLLGHKSSDELRPTVMEVFSEEFSKEHPIGPYRFLFRMNLIHFFGDYVNYFADDLKPEAKPFSQESRFNSFYEMLGRFRDKIGLCHKGLLPKEEMIPWIRNKPDHNCHDYAMNPALFKKWFTDEMAFVFLANWQFDVAHRILNSEYIFAPFEDQEFLATAQVLVGWTCGVIERNHGSFMEKEVEDKALRYCNGVRNSLSPKGKDRN